MEEITMFKRISITESSAISELLAREQRSNGVRGAMKLSAAIQAIRMDLISFEQFDDVYAEKLPFSAAALREQFRRSKRMTIFYNSDSRDPDSDVTAEFHWHDGQSNKNPRITATARFIGITGSLLPVRTRVRVDLCDKCGLEVLETNNATTLECAVHRSAFAALANNPRHLLPHVVDRVVLCPGSPSRAQYIEGQPRDSRSEYPYLPDREAQIRAAYEALQKAG